MAEDSARLLGFAFASADFLFELDSEGRVACSLGAARRIFGAEPHVPAGETWRAFICDEDIPLVAAFLDSLETGDRRGPIRVGLKSPAGQRRRIAGLSACRLPQLAPRISCALSSHVVASAPKPDGLHGLHTAEGLGLLAETLLKQAAQTGIELTMELVELNGLKQEVDGMGKAEAAQAMARIAAVLRAESLDGVSAAKLEEDRYALLRTNTESSERVAERLGRAISGVGLTQIHPTVRAVELGMNGAAEEVKALRLALDRFIAGGAGGGAGASLSGVIKQTVTEAAKLKMQIATRRFSMAYQPVVDLRTGATDHFEALVRLQDGASPAESILMAESLDIIQDLDFAVVQAVLAELRKPARRGVRLAANISARSLMQPAFAAKLADLVRDAQDVRGRLTLEITESAAIDDLAAADALVRQLRKDGCKMSLDDFGSGAASLDHLRAIAVDEVKIDGRYIRELTSVSDRNGLLVQHVSELCRQLGVSTVAEMVETERTADVLRQIGVDFGQGFLFGRPQPEPQPAPRRSAPVTRRSGTVDSWG